VSRSAIRPQQFEREVMTVSSITVAAAEAWVAQAVLPQHRTIASPIQVERRTATACGRVASTPLSCRRLTGEGTGGNAAGMKSAHPSAPLCGRIQSCEFSRTSALGKAKHGLCDNHCDKPHSCGPLLTRTPFRKSLIFLTGSRRFALRPALRNQRSRVRIAPGPLYRMTPRRHLPTSGGPFFRRV
jgi:hypothetical protein